MATATGERGAARRRGLYAQPMSYRYFVWRASDGHVLGIARTSGPVMQSLTVDDAWVDNSALLASLQEPVKYEEVSESAARAAAPSSKIRWS